MGVKRHLFQYLIATIAVLMITGVAAAQQSASRLPDFVVPLHYQLDFTIIPDAETFTGTALIDVRLEKPVKTIALHGRGLSVSEASIVMADGKVVPASYLEDTDQGKALLEAATVLDPGVITLRFDYSGEIATSLVGLYRSQDGSRSYAYTQMQPIRARRVFPGFDEPRFKTPFDISIEHKSEHIAVSNGPEKSSAATNDGLVRTRFATTKPLPTYLVAMAVGEFDVVEWEPLPPTEIRNRAIPLRGIAPKGEGGKLRYALENTRAMFEILENWFEIPYPYAKLDLVAAHSLNAWGMENAGAIFYRADRLLLPDPPSVFATRDYASLHAHELAHSWFGNFVTPIWWDEIWLNESFATWMADKTLTLWQPSQYPSHNAVKSAGWAMWNDRLAGARAVRRPVLTDGDIAHAFDSTSYTKGGGVLTMIEGFMGKASFRQAIQKHLLAHPHGVASTEELLEALSSVAGQPDLIRATRSFLDQPGVPFVEATLDCTPGQPVNVEIKQSRFLPLGSTGDADKQWLIPVCLAYGKPDGSRAEQCQLLPQTKAASILLNTDQCPAWLLPNGGGAAYMVYDLDGSGWDFLTANFDRLTIAEQISTATSINAAFLAGRIDTARLLQLVELLGKSPEWDVSRTIMQMLRTLKFGVVPEKYRSNVEKAARSALAAHRAQFDLEPESFGINIEDPVRAKQRADLFWFLALDAGDVELHKNLAEAGRKYTGYDSFRGMDYDQLHPDLVWVGLIAALEETGPKFAEHLIELLAKGFDRPLHNSFLGALGNSTDPVIVGRVREHMLDPDTPTEDVLALFRRQTRRSDNAQSTLKWITEHYDQLLDILPASQHPWLAWRVARSCDLEARDRIKSFFEPRVAKLAGAPRALKNVLENVSLCVALKEAQRPGVIAAFGE